MNVRFAIYDWSRRRRDSGRPTITWTDPAEQISGVTMLQQRVGVVQADVERAIRQAIID